MIEVRFNGKRRSMWRKIFNPPDFFAPERGWVPMGAKVTVIGDAVIIMSWYHKNDMDAWFASMRPQY